MKKTSVLVLLIMMSILASCNVHEENLALDNGKIKVVTTLFPQYDFSKVVAGDMADVKLLLPPGMEAHSYEPTPQDIIAIEKADLFLYTGAFMEPWVEKVLASIDNPDLVIVDVSQGIELMDHEHEHEHEDEHEHEHDDNHGSYDPHIWVDPVYAMQIVDNVKDGFVALDPEHSEIYENNSRFMIKELQNLHNQFEVTVNQTENKTIIVGGHFAFGYWAERYGIDYVSAYDGFAPNAEPTSRRIAELIDHIRNFNVSYIYHEELVDPKVAKIIADETGAKLLVLHAAHNLTKAEMKAGETYLSIMTRNLENIKMGLGYHE